MSFVFEFVYIVDYVDGFPHIKPSLLPWDEALLVMMDDPFDVFLDSVTKHFMEYFCIDIHEVNWSEFLSQPVYPLCRERPPICLS